MAEWYIFRWPNGTFSDGRVQALLYPRFDEILAVAVDSGVRINLITNGTLLSSERLERLAAGGCQLVVSLDGASASSFEWHRPGASLQAVLSNLSAWPNARRRAEASGRQPSLTGHITLTSMNIEEAGDIVALMGKLEFDGVFVSIVRRSQMSDAMWTLLNLDTCRERVHTALLKCEEQAKKYAMSFDSSCEKPISVKRPESQMCCAPWEHVYIAWDGSVYPCCQFQSPLGNCIEESFSAIWQRRKGVSPTISSFSSQFFAV
jgi:MoaA/NifB/PqqE/SkfB family radical SAM enzyme